MAYRQQMGIAPDGVAMAVVVQVMVQADVSGIVFTANPHSGDRDELVINASFGLGEAIVGGEITADSYRVERATLAVRETRLGSKALRIVSAPGQGTRHETLTPALQATSSLPEALLRTLCARALAVEAAFGGVPQDIEWAFVGQTLWLLQARPITHLPPPPLRDVRWQAPADDAGGLYLRNQLVEHIPEPASTLFEDVYLHDALQVAWGRTQRSLRPADTRPPACWITHRCINGYAYKRIGPPPWPADLPRPPPPPPAPPGSYDVMNFRYLKTSVRRAVAHWRDVGMPTYRATIAAQAALNVEHATPAELLAAVRALAQADASAWFGGIYGAFNSARMVETMLDRFLSAHLPGKRTGVFLAGLDSKTMRAQHALFAIAERIRADAALRARLLATPAVRLEVMLAADAGATWVLDAVREVLIAAGTQLSSLDFAEPTAAENLVPTLTNLQALVADAARNPHATQQLLAERRAAADAEALAALPPKRRREFRWRLAITRRYYPYREEGLACAGEAWPLLRRFALALGGRLVAAGCITKADDVFFLTTAEIESASVAPTSLSALVGERRLLREQQKRLRPPFQVPETVPADSPWAGFVAGIAARRGARPPLDAQTLTGNAVATGRVTAMASVILEPADFARMQPGSILVCPTTTPVWTQLFSQARGLVTDTGSFLAHGAIVAREFGIPAVLGVADATARIRHGQMLAIDGDAGTVTLLDADADADDPGLS